MGLVCFIVGVSVAILFQNCATKPALGNNSVVALDSVTRTVAASAAPPWGRISYSRLALSRPTDVTEDHEIFKLGKTKWVFNRTPDDLGKFFAGLDLNASVRAFLLGRDNWHQLVNGSIAIYPPATLVAEMSPNARGTLYSALTASGENPLHRWPFRFREDGEDLWFRECGLHEDKLKLARKFLYTNSGTLAFADLPAFAELSSAEDTRKLVKCLSRVSTFIMRLDLGKESDIARILSWWKVPGQSQSYAPLLESLSRESDHKISIAALLPPFARLRLYTYPDPADPNAQFQDCIWSSMNFTATTPDNRFFKKDYFQQVLQRECMPVGDPLKFGDVLVFLTPSNDVAHMCVYLADDVVFTKNGANLSQPWQLMHLSEVKGLYSWNGSLRIQAFRRLSSNP